MTTQMFEPKPPVAPPPPRFSPPRQEPPHNRHPLPVPPTAGPAATHGAGYEIKGAGSKHKTVIRVGSTTPGVHPTETTNPREALDKLRELIDQAVQAGQTADLPPMPTSLTLTITHVPQAVA